MPVTEPVIADERSWRWPVSVVPERTILARLAGKGTATVWSELRSPAPEGRSKATPPSVLSVVRGDATDSVPTTSAQSVPSTTPGAVNIPPAGKRSENSTVPETTLTPTTTGQAAGAVSRRS